MLEPRINILTEQAGLIIGSEEEHLAFLRKTSFSVLNDIVPLAQPDLEGLKFLNNNLKRDPHYVDCIIKTQINFLKEN